MIDKANNDSDDPIKNSYSPCCEFQVVQAPARK